MISQVQSQNITPKLQEPVSKSLTRAHTTTEPQNPQFVTKSMDLEAIFKKYLKKNQ